MNFNHVLKHNSRYENGTEHYELEVNAFSDKVIYFYHYSSLIPVKYDSVIERATETRKLVSNPGESHQRL